MISKVIFSNNLRHFMEREGMNQVELAEHLGVTKAAVNYWVNGRSIPQVTVVQKIAELFACSTDELLKRQTDIVPSGTPEERLIFIFRQLSDEGKKYLLQQASIAAAMYGKKDLSPSDTNVI